jgi:SAM-dependent methyltransferase
MTDWTRPACWYDVLNPWGAGDEFYLGLVMGAGSVLDVGCGTRTLLRRAREAGHGGRLCGLDPDPAMLDQARARGDVEWVLADAASAGWDREFDLAGRGACASSTRRRWQASWRRPGSASSSSSATGSVGR